MTELRRKMLEKLKLRNDEFRAALELREKHNGTPEQRATILYHLCLVVGSFGDKAEGIEYETARL